MADPEGTDPRRTFGKSAGRYLVSTDHGTGPDLEVIRRVASDLFPPVTVDIAAGAGHALKAALPFSGTCIALDLTREMLEVARKDIAASGAAGVHFIQSSAGDLPFADGSVSLLTCRIAAHHFPSIPGFLSEAWRVLNLEGRGVIIDSVAPQEPEYDAFINSVERFRDPSHVQSYTLERWAHCLREARFRVLYRRIFERTHPFLEWARRVGLGEDEVRKLEGIFLDAPGRLRTRFKVEQDTSGRVRSYTDEKGIWVVEKQGGP